MKKKLIALTMVMAMVFMSLVGCGKSENDLLTDAMTAAQKAKSVTGKMTMDISMKLTMGTQSQDVSMKMDADMVAFNDPQKVKTTMTMNLLGQNITSESYAKKEGSNLVTYAKNNGKWTKTSLPVGDQKANQMDASVFLSEAAGFKKAEDKTEGDKKYSVYEGKLTKEMMEKSIDSLGSSGASLGSTDKSTTDEILKNMKDIPLTVWIDQDSRKLFRVQFSMTDYMKSVMDTAAKKSTSTASMNTEVSKCDIKIDYTGYDNAQDFDIPKEALEAK